MGPAQVQPQADQPGQQAQARHPRGGDRIGGSVRRGHRWPSWATTSRRSATRTARAAPTASPRRAASTPPRIIRTTATACSGFFTTRSRAAISARAKPTSIAWPRSASILLTNAWRKACPSRANTAACWPTAPLAARRCRAPFTRAARPASSFCWAHTRRCAGRLPPEKSRCFRAPKCWTWWSSTAMPGGLSCAIWSPGRFPRTRATRWCWPPAAMPTSFIFPPTPRAATSPPPGALTRRARPLPIPVTPRFTPPASRSAAIINPSSPSCPSRCATMAGSGRRRKRATRAPPADIPEEERDYYLERKYPSFGNLAPRDISSRAAKEVCDEGRGVGPGGRGVYLDFADAIQRLGEAGRARALRKSI